jgi:uncharacterized protein YbjT (DUF2867 family)
MYEKGKVILVTGATGNQGGAVAGRLHNEGWRVRALIRDPGKPEARKLAETGIEVVKGDLDDRASIDKVIKDVYGVFAVLTPFTDKGLEGEIKQGKDLADAAKAARVSHYVYSSVGGADKKTGIPHFESKYEIEKHISSLGLPSTVFRPVFFYYNFNSDMLRQSILGGTLSMAIKPDKPLQMLAVEDLAVFVAKAFDNPGEYIGKTVELAGEELTMPQAAESFGKVLGKPVKYVEMPIEQVRSYSEDFARMFEWFNKHGYDVDIKSLRELHPEMLTLEQWLRKTGWHKAAAKAA